MPHCKALTNQLHVNVCGEYRPCCAYPKTTGFSVNNTNPNDFLQSEFMEKIRKEMETGWHEHCKNCKTVEETGAISVRKSFNVWCKENSGTLEYLDISLNNQCNLTCRMCSEISSSKWSKILGLSNPEKISLSTIIDALNLDNLRHVKYVGGEPFITPEIEDVLKLVAEKETIFNFVTNLTFYPKKYESHLLKAKSLYACYSIDGYQTLNDYIRTSDWKTVETVLDLWINFFKTNNIKGLQTVSTVVQALNFHDLKNLKKFIQDKGLVWIPQVIIGPAELGLNALPEKYIENVKDDVNEKFLINYKFDSHLFEKFKNKISKQDKMLGLELKKINPQLYSYFE